MKQGCDEIPEARAADSIPAALDLLRPSRRQLLKTGVLGCAVLGLATLAAPARAGGKARAHGGDAHFAFLTADDRVIVAAIAPVILDGAFPPEGAARARAAAEVVEGVDQAISGLPPATQAELRQLFDLLGLGIARVLVAGLWPSWEEAAPEDIARFLEAWRGSWFSLLRSGYLGLHELVFATWYGKPRSWARIGYPGPPEVR